MIVIDKLVTALFLEANNFKGAQKEELQKIILKIDCKAFPTEEELKKNLLNILKFLKLKNETQKIFSEYVRKYKEFGGSKEILDDIIRENLKL